MVVGITLIRGSYWFGRYLPLGVANGLCISPCNIKLASPAICLITKRKYRPVKKEKLPKIWNRITIWQLTKTLQKDLNYLEEVIKPRLKEFITPETGEITNLKAVKAFLKEQNIIFQEINVAHTKEKKQERAELPLAHSKSGNEIKRPPVVTIMGHVDHGKTTLLDSLRGSNIVSGEFGGITQHIGAFSVKVKRGDSVTFIDTPGHAAFKNMRARGANATDIVVLIVAADDGVMEQTVESIKMAKNADVKIIVAVNKIDKGEHNLEKIKQQLLHEGVQVEDLGGNVQLIPISAKEKINLDLLVEAILIEAEMMNLVSDPTAPLRGVIIESHKEQQGKCATVLVKSGTLRKRAILVAGQAMARVKQILDENGCSLKEATLSRPAQVFGWRDLPVAGDDVLEVDSEKEAQILIKDRKRSLTDKKLKEDYIALQEKSVQEHFQFVSRRNIIQELKSTRNVKALYDITRRSVQAANEPLGPRLNIIIKADTDGSLDAILSILRTYDDHDKCKLNIVNSGVGSVVPTDVHMALTFDATIYCFNVEYPQNLKEELTSKTVKIKFFNVIYSLMDELVQEINSNIPVKDTEQIIGEAVVLQHFFISEKRRKVPVAGSECISGELRKNSLFRVIRDDEVIHNGPLKSLKHLKNEVNTIKKGVQCGIMFKDFAGEFKNKDRLICYDMIQVPDPTDWNPGF